MQEQTAIFESSLPSKPETTKRAKRGSEPKESESEEPVSAPLVDEVALVHLLDSTLDRINAGDFVRLPFLDSADIVVESDLAFGFVWTIVRGIEVLGGGAETTLNGVAKTAIALHGRA
jgi:hypothetical protein